MTKRYDEERILNEVMQPFADLGIPLILAPPGSKNPLTKGWPDRATTEPNRLKNMASTVAETGGSIFAVTRQSKARTVPSPVFVLDPDVGDHKNGLADLAALQKEYSPLPDTPTRDTPRGGQHLIFAANGLWLSGRGKLPKSIDVPGGFCIFRDGEPYHWVEGKSFEDLKPADPPEWLIEKLTAGWGGKREGAGKQPDLPSAIEQASICLWKMDSGRVDDHEDWINVGMALYHTFARFQGADFNLGFAMWDEWSKRSEKYKEGECARRWKTFEEYHGDTLGLGSLREWAQADMANRGDKFKLPKVKRPAVNSEELLEALAAYGYEFRLNLAGRILEVSEFQEPFEPMVDDLERKIQVQLRDNGYGRNLEYAHDAWWAQARDNGYHPIRDWMLALAWDEKDHIADLASYFSDKHDLFPLAMRRWLIGAVARVMRTRISDPSVQVWVLVLLGAQGIGKSYLAEWLVGPHSMYFHEGGVNPNDKDDRIRRASMFVWEVSELGAVKRKSDREALKAFFSTKNQRDRHAYGHYDTHSPAMVSYIGTLNETEFLDDPSGNRRFVTCDLTRIDKKYARKIDVEQLWAQAVALWKAGEQWELTPEEAGRRDAANQEYEVVDPFVDFISEFFVLGIEDAKAKAVDVATVLKQAEIRYTSEHALSFAIGTAMKKLNVKKKLIRQDDGTRPTYYLGVALSKRGRNMLTGSEISNLPELISQIVKEQKEK